MTRPSGSLTVTGLVALVVLAACSSQDGRLKKLSAGISKDSVVAVMSGQPPHRTDAYITGGHSIEALYFTLAGKRDSASLADRRMSPAILIDGKLAAWGWSQWDSVAGTYKIQVAKPKS